MTKRVSKYHRIKGDQEKTPSCVTQRGYRRQILIDVCLFVPFIQLHFTKYQILRMRPYALTLIDYPENPGSAQPVPCTVLSEAVERFEPKTKSAGEILTADFLLIHRVAVGFDTTI